MIRMVRLFFGLFHGWSQVGADSGGAHLHQGKSAEDLLRQECLRGEKIVMI